MALVEDTKVATELNFGQRESSYPVYHYRNVYPANGATRNITLTSGGERQQTIFNIPAEQVNMGDSYLDYRITVPAQGAGNYTWIYRDVYGEFDSVLYRDTGSQYLEDIRHANLHNSVVSRLDTSAEDLLYNDEVNGLYSSSSTTATDPENLRPNGDSISLMFKEPVNLSVSPANTAIFLNRRVYLKDLTGKHSYFGMAKDSLFPQETYFEIGWIGNRIGYASPDNTNPSNSYTDASDNVTPIVLSDLSGNITISNIVLKLAIQTNQDIIKVMKENLAKGITIPIPWTRVHTFQGSAASQVTYNLTLDNKQHGRKVKRLIYVPFASAKPAGTAMHAAYDHINNDNNPKLLTYNTELDNAKLQRDILNIANYDDYMIHKKILKNTTYFNQNIYNYYWVHIDTFDNPESNKNADGSIYTDGYSLDKPTIWSVNKYSGSSDAIYNFAIVQGQKLLSVDSTSILVT